MPWAVDSVLTVPSYWILGKVPLERLINATGPIAKVLCLSCSKGVDCVHILSMLNNSGVKRLPSICSWDQLSFFEVFVDFVAHFNYELFIFVLLLGANYPLQSLISFYCSFFFLIQYRGILTNHTLIYRVGIKSPRFRVDSHSSAKLLENRVLVFPIGRYLGVFAAL